MLAAVLALALADGPAGIVTEMTPALIRQAIQEGRVKPKKGLLGGLGLKPPVAPGQYPQGGRRRPCLLMTPYSRVVFASHLAFADHRPFTAKDVTPGLIAPEVWVVCSPVTREGRPVDVRTIALTDGGRAVPALRMETSQLVHEKPFGATYHAVGMTAAFPLSAVRPGAEIHVIYSDGDDAKVRLDLTDVR